MKSILIIALVALGALLAACGSEQQSDPAVLDSPPDLGANLGAARIDKMTSDDGSTLTHGFTFTPSPGRFVVLQIDSSADRDSTTTDWSIDSAKPLIAKLTDAEPQESSTFALAPNRNEPADVKAWTGKSGTETLYAEAWERNQCVALIISSLPKGETATVIRKADEYLIRACGE